MRSELYGTAAIRENKLEQWPNPHPERPYLISFDIPEFTCLCPRSGFPDFALIKIRYQPARLDRGAEVVEAVHQRLSGPPHLTRGGGESNPGRSRLAAPTPLDAGDRRLLRARQHQDRGPSRARLERESGDWPRRACAVDSRPCLPALSGGLDSATWPPGSKSTTRERPVKAFTFLYGQKHAVELEAARSVAAAYGLEHQVIELPPIHGSALTDAEIELPEGRDLATVTGVAPSYVPARNLLFLAQMASLQDAFGPAVLVAGRPSRRSHRLPRLPARVRGGGRPGGPTGHAVWAQGARLPSCTGRRPTSIRWGLEHGVPYELTHSCYQGRRPACGVCDTCQARLQAFAAAGAIDPIDYAPDSGTART